MFICYLLCYYHIDSFVSIYSYTFLVCFLFGYVGKIFSFNQMLTLYVIIDMCNLSVFLQLLILQLVVNILVEIL